MPAEKAKNDTCVVCGSDKRIKDGLCGRCAKAEKDTGGDE